MDINRKVRIWGLVTAEAGRRGGRVSVAVACQAAIGVLAVDGATVSAIGPGDVHVPAFATSEIGRRLDDLQSMLGEGPGLQSYSDGAPVLKPDLGSTDARWPLFGQGAVEIGVRALFAFPLWSAASPIGVLELHRSDVGALSREQFDDALVLADIVSLLLLGTDGQNEHEYIRNAVSVDHHAELYQATGMLSVHLGMNLADALARLRGHAFAHGQSISAVAHEIVNGRLRLDDGDSDD